MPDRAPGGFDGAFRRGMFAGQMRYPAKCMTVPEEMALSPPASRRWENTKYTSQYALVRLPRVAECLRLPLLGQHAQIVAARSSSDLQSSASVASSRPALAVTICCIKAMKRF